MAEERTDVLFCKIDIGDAAQDEFHDLVAGHGTRSLPTFQASDVYARTHTHTHTHI